MAVREFTITELRSEGSGFVSTPIKFIWTNTERSAPRPSWRFGLEQRSVREDYPGAEQPVEQVLGWNFKPFTITGMWDDRYMGEGKALETWRKFEQLVQRGNLVEIQFETVVVRGLLKNAEFDYKRAQYIAYTFEVSPHNRSSGDGRSSSGNRSLSGSSSKNQVKNQVKSADELRDVTLAQANSMNEFNEVAPQLQTSGTLYNDIALGVSTIQAAMQTVVTAVDQRIDSALDTFESLKRTAHAFAIVKTEAANLASDLRVLRSDTQMAWDSAVGILDYEVWVRGLHHTARSIVISSDDAEKELNRRRQPNAAAIYRPSKGESLLAISVRFYGNANQWRTIAERNGLNTIILQGTEQLIIPELK